MVWLYHSHIPAGRRGVIYLFKWYLPAFRGLEERGGGRHPVSQPGSIIGRSPGGGGGGGICKKSQNSTQKWAQESETVLKILLAFFKSSMQQTTKQYYCQLPNIFQSLWSKNYVGLLLRKIKKLSQHNVIFLFILTSKPTGVVYRKWKWIFFSSRRSHKAYLYTQILFFTVYNNISVHLQKKQIKSQTWPLKIRWDFAPATVSQSESYFVMCTVTLGYLFCRNFSSPWNSIFWLCSQIHSPWLGGYNL